MPRFYLGWCTIIGLDAASFWGHFHYIFLYIVIVLTCASYIVWCLVVYIVKSIVNVNDGRRHICASMPASSYTLNM